MAFATLGVMATALGARRPDAAPMAAREARAVTLDDRGAPAADIPLRDALAEVGRGNLVVVRGALQALGVFDGMLQTTLAEVARVASPAAAERVGAEGVESLHRQMDAAQLFALLDALTARFTPRTGELIAGFAHQLLGHQGPIYIGGKFWVRFFVPHDVYEANHALFSTRPGHLEILGPHRDSWFTSPTNAVTLWIAMGRVRRGNSMMVYRGLWNRPVQRDTLTVPAPQRFGEPAIPELDAGDVLLFSGEHLHASELNVTDETRYVLTIRFTPAAPRYGEGLRWRPYADLRFLDSRLPGLATLRSRLSAAWLRQRVQGVRHAVRHRVPLVGRLGV